MRLQVRSLALLSGLTIQCCLGCGVGCRRSSDPVLLWLWWRPAATAPIQPLVWEPPYATGAALEKTQKKKKKRERERNEYFKTEQPRVLPCPPQLNCTLNTITHELKFRHPEPNGLWVKDY